MTIIKEKYPVYLIYILVIFSLIISGILLRLLIFDKTGGDYITYKNAMNLFHQGQNPYILTVKSFAVENVEHGYAYFPTLLYIQYFIWLIDNFSGVIISTVILWKIPVLVADIAILYLILKKLGPAVTVKDHIYRIGVICFWMFNPYLLARYDYSLYDPLFLLALLLALEKLDDASLISGFFYALSVSLKTVPVILLPLFILRTKDKFRFIMACILVFLVISLPFTRSFNDFSTYIQGSFFVHSQRELQGRPFLSFLNYYLQGFGIGFFQDKLVKVYSLIALVGAFFVPLVLYLKKKLSNKYSWVLLSFSIYLIFTPVLSRTHILWLFPWLIIYLYEKYSRIKKLDIATIILAVVWVLSFTYLYYWDNGIDIVSNDEGRQILVMDSSDKEWELKRILRQKYYEFRGSVRSQ